MIATKLRSLAAVLAAALLLASCTSPDGEPSATTSATTSPESPESGTVVTAEPAAAAFGLPAEALASSGGGQPRPAAYWAVWNTCADDNRAAEAEANGGRAAGWVLVDDILAFPGVGLGDHVLTTCEESVALLGGRTGAGDDTEDPAFALAAQLLAAELNLNVGSETCPAAEEAVIGAHLVLATARFDGVSATPLDAEGGGALPTLLELLTAYNTGDLCR